MPTWKHTVYVRRSDYSTWSKNYATNVSDQRIEFSLANSSVLDYINAGFTVTSWTMQADLEPASSSGVNALTRGFIYGRYNGNVKANFSTRSKIKVSYTGDSSNLSAVRSGNIFQFGIYVYATPNPVTVTWIAFPEVIVNFSKTTSVTAGNPIYASDAYVVVGGTTHKARSDVGVGNPIKYGSAGTTITASYWNNLTITI